MAVSPEPSRGPGLAALCIVMMILSTLAVILRIWSRLTSKKQRFWWDDWCAIMSLPLVLATLSTILLLVPTGLGRHKSQFDPEKLSLALKYSYVHELLYQPAITMPKYSALLFYVRVFEVKWDSRLFRMNILVCVGLVTVWFLFALLFDVFQCTPIRKVWVPLIPGHCINTTHWFLGIATVSVIVDFYIMLLPLPILWSLHAGRKRKMILTGFFFCAYCVITCSLGRVVAIVQLKKKSDGDLLLKFSTFFYWTVAELAISIVSICLPNMTQLLRRAHQHGVSALFTRREYPAGTGSRSKKGLAGFALLQGNKGGFQRVIGNDDTTLPANNNPLINKKDQSGLYRASASAQQSGEGETIALGQVHLRHDIDVRENGGWAMV